MRCPKGETLSAYLDGELDKRTEPKVKRHRIGCERGAKTIQILKQAGEVLAKGQGDFLGGSPKAGANCLEDDVIGAYAEGSLKSQDALTVEEHISSCSQCLRKFASVSEMLSTAVEEVAAEVPSPLLEKAKGLVRPPRTKLFELAISLKGSALRVVSTTVDALQLLGSGLADTMKPVPVREAQRAGQSGAKVEGVIIHQKEGGMDFRFEVVNMGEERCRVRLILRDVHSLVPKAGLRVSLWEGKRILQSQPTSDKGEVIMENVAVGNYLVRVTDIREWEIPLSLIREKAAS